MGRQQFSILVSLKIDWFLRKKRVVQLPISSTASLKLCALNTVHRESFSLVKKNKLDHAFYINPLLRGVDDFKINLRLSKLEI